MLDSFKRLFLRQGHDRDLTLISDWAQQRGYGFKRARGEDGFVIDGQLDGRPWRIEWGPPQRDYIRGHELRLRMELDLSSDAQMLVLSRPLMDSLERKTFEEFTDNVQTQIGTQTPEEMRWLVMFPKVDLSPVKEVRPHFGAVASTPGAGLAWVEGALADALLIAHAGLLREDPPFVLMAMRGRTYLRMQLARPEPRALTQAVRLFEVAVEQAVDATSRHRLSSVTDWPASASTAWQDIQPQGPGNRVRR